MDTNLDEPRKTTLPENAKKVFTGIIFDVYQWEQEQFDGSTKTFEMLSRPDTVQAILVTADKKIVLAKQEQPGNPPFLSLVGGRSEKKESPLSAIKREALEESGMEAKTWHLLDAYQFHSKFDWLVYTFIGKGAVKVSEQNLDSGEKIQLMEVSVDEFIEIAAKDPEYRDLEVRIKVLDYMVNGKISEFKELLLAD